MRSGSCSVSPALPPAVRAVMVRLEGEAGAGKSHLAGHFVREAAKRGLHVVSAACQSTAQNIAYFAAQQFMRSLLDLPPALDGDAAEAKTDASPAGGTSAAGT